jgi:hypothetical protein
MDKNDKMKETREGMGMGRSWGFCAMDSEGNIGI